MTNLASIHEQKSEYQEARNIHVELLQNNSSPQREMHNAFSLLHIASINVIINADFLEVQQNLEINGKRKLELYQALRFLGNVFLSEEDEQTAHNIFIVALEGFTYIDTRYAFASLRR
ncbi:hypothetical protein C8R44DRAFT_725948 [Mycena epipterygia]|nr:hypothetical protein C8R44DRAFT_725948 [Mycena epipterygia]